MSIKLSFYLNRNKTDLKKMCTQLNIDSYEALILHCFSMRIECDISEKEYDEIFTKKEVAKNENKKRKPKVKASTKVEEQSKPKTRRRGRKPKAKTDGDADK